MEGRYPKGIIVALTSCTAPDKLDDFNDVYNRIYLPDATASGFLTNALRFENVDADHSGRQFVTTYETDWDDVVKARSLIREHRDRMREKGRSLVHAAEAPGGGVFERIAGEFQSARNKPVNGILALLINLDDPSRAEEFHDWYSDIHIPDILDAGCFHTAYRYEAVDPEVSAGKYLAVYESEYVDLESAYAEASKKARYVQDPSRIIEGTTPVWRVLARRIFPPEARS